MELIPHGTNIDFIGKAKYFIVFSFFTVVASYYIFFSKGQEKYGIDFLGGHEILVNVESAEGTQQVRDALEKAGIKDPQVQSFEVGSHQYSIRLGGDAGDAKAARDQVENALKPVFNQGVSVIKTDFVGPIVGDELKRDAVIALTVGMIVMLIYIAFRFELSFAFGAVVALFHDVSVCLGGYLLAGHTLTMGAVAAALTIVGYSLNDTIVIFDRVREEMHKQKNSSLAKIMNESVNFTLSRTIVTSLLTFFSALALLLIGGGSISDLSLFLVIGIVAGSYSTIFIASPAALFWERLKGRA